MNCAFHSSSSPACFYSAEKDSYISKEQALVYDYLQWNYSTLIKSVQGATICYFCWQDITICFIFNCVHGVLMFITVFTINSHFCQKSCQMCHYSQAQPNLQLCLVELSLFPTTYPFAGILDLACLDAR